ncbi:MAG: rhomboid family intramembrane serine protease [Labilithrix sp.]|nr:rhomboid family intramembrane serine protease [Labilithrix sp.]MBX3225371.1 rhomboid family intramembrane serine protease [Labilithrix sp.]
MTPRRLPERLSFGGRVPWGVGLVIVLTLALSLTIAFGDRHAGSLFELTALAPAAVWGGQVWRLVTWAFIEPGPLELVFACIFLYWFGGELGREWGSRRFLAVFGGIVLAAALVTCLVARVDGDVLAHRYMGGWATGAALVVAWGLWFPDRVIRIWFVIPVRGYILAWFTVGLTVVFAIYSGWERVLPVLAAEGAMLAWLFRGRFVARWARLRRSAAAGREARQREVVRRDRAKKRAASVDYLRLVESHDDATPNLPPEVDAKLDDLLRRRPKGSRSDDD